MVTADSDGDKMIKTNAISDKISMFTVKSFLYLFIGLIYLYILIYFIIGILSFLGINNYSDKMDLNLILSFIILSFSLTLICQNEKINNISISKLAHNFLFSSLLFIFSLFSINAYGKLNQVISKIILDNIITWILVLALFIFSHSFFKLLLLSFLELSIINDFENWFKKIKNTSFKIEIKNTYKKGNKK